MNLNQQDFAVVMQLYKGYLCYHIDPHICDAIIKQCFLDGYLEEEKYIELYHMPVNRKASFLIELVCTRKGRLVATFRDVLINRGLEYVVRTLDGNPTPTSFFEDFYKHSMQNHLHEFEKLSLDDLFWIYGPSLMDPETCQEILAERTPFSQRRKLLDYVCKRPNTVLPFLKALREENFSHLVEKLEGGDDGSTPVFNLMSSGIEEKLEPNDILPHIGFDQKAIKHISGIKSREQRVKAFLSILVTKKNWFKILLTAIRDANEGKYDEVLHRLEPGSDSESDGGAAVSRQNASKSKVDSSTGTMHLNIMGSSCDDQVLKSVPNDFEQKAETSNASSYSGKRTLVLTEEQKELAATALQGENCVMVAPTGFGKTYVALYVCKKHLESRNVQGKAVILTPTGPLTEQHYAEVKAHFDERKYKIAKLGGGGSASTPAAGVMDDNSIIVMTPKKLLNVVNEGDFDWGKITLLVFDECHHAVKNEPYNEIMEHIFERLLACERVPQIVGLTATPGSGPASNVDSAVDHVIQLLANLNVMTPPVEVAGSDMPFYSVAVERPTNNDFEKTIVTVMKVIEDSVKTLLQRNINATNGFEFKPLRRWGYPDYQNAVNDLKNFSQSLLNEDLRPKLQTCASHLLVYNEALIVSELLRTADARDFIHDELFGHHSNSETDQKMKSLYDKSGAQGKASNQPGGLLEKAVDMLRQHFLKKKTSRCIVFVKERRTAQLLVECLAESPLLEPFSLNPTYFTGSNAPSSKGGLTKAQQDERLRQFREGNCKLLVATNVAEEGINIRECNLVIAYNYCSNDVGQIQRKGRGRTKDSEMYLLAYGDLKFIEKEKTNEERNKLVHRALQKLRVMDRDALKTKVGFDPTSATVNVISGVAKLLDRSLYTF